MQISEAARRFSFGSYSPNVPATIWVAIAGLGAGLLTALVGDWAGESTLRMVALPFTLIFLLWLIIDRLSLFYVIVLTRDALDRTLAATKIGGTGFGAVFNAVMLMIAALFIIHDPRPFKKVALRMWGPLIIVSGIAAFRAPDITAGAKTFLAFCSYMAVFTIPFYIDSLRSSLKNCSILLLASSLIPVSYAFVDYHNGGAGGELGNRVRSTFGHPNILAFYSVLIIVLAFYLLKDKNANLSPKWRFLTSAYILILLVVLILTGTRSAWAGCVFYFIGYGIIRDRRFLLWLCLFGALLLFLPPVRDRLGDLGAPAGYVTSYTQESSYAWRVEVWQHGLGSLGLSDFPFGKGLEAFIHNSSKFDPKQGWSFGAHNVFVQTLYEMGVVGLVAAAWLFGSLVQASIKLRKRHPHESLVTLLLIVSYLLFCYSDNMFAYLSFNWYFALVMGVACSLALDKESHKRNVAEAALGSAFRPLGS